MQAVDDTGRWRWERVLLVLAALFGVGAMHSTVGSVHEPAMSQPAAVASVDGQPISMSSAVASLSLVEHTVPAMAASSDMPGHGPMSMPHALMHLCLAFLSAGIVLGLLAVAVAVLLGHGLTPSPTPVPVATRPSRPPRRSALRLAQLCVLRN